MRGTGNWVTNQMPENWREAVLYLYPNGMAPLTGMLSMMASEDTDSPKIHWWDKSFQNQRGAVTDVYDDPGLGTAYTTGGVEGTTVYVNMSAADVSHFRPGMQVVVRTGEEITKDIHGKVTGRVDNAANSYLAVRLLEADGSNYLAGTSLTIHMIGTMHPEGGQRPQAVAYDPTERYNYTEIWRWPLIMTRTAQKTKLRTGDQYAQAKMEALEYHSVSMEKSLMWGTRWQGTGTNGMPERAAGGLYYFIKAQASGNISNYVTDDTGGWADKTWVLGGEDWLNYYLEQYFTYGATEKLGLCGSGVLSAIAKLAKTGADINITPGTTDYGLKVLTWITPHGTLHLKSHPLLTQDATTKNLMFVVEPRLLKWRPHTETMFKGDDTWRKGGGEGIDALQEEFLTEGAYEIHHPSAMGILYGFGQDNPA
jgi:hypothetical protein